MPRHVATPRKSMSDSQNPYGNNPYGNQPQNPLGQQPNPYGNQPNPNNPYPPQPQYGAPQHGAPQYGGQQYGYQPPQKPFAQNGRPNAELGTRFLGAMVDWGAGVLFAIPGLIMLFFSATALIMEAENNRGEMPAEFPVALITSFLILGLGSLVLLGVQIYFLATKSQTIGKWVMNMQIVDNDTGQPANFVKSFVIRSFLNGLISCVPYIGGLYGLIDILFIFGDERRCLHDQLANTRVVSIA